MKYSEIPDHLKEYVALSEDIFDVSPEVVQRALISAAERTYQEHQRAIQEREARRRAEVELERLGNLQAQFPHLAAVEREDSLAQQAAPGVYEDNDPRYLNMLNEVYEREDPFIMKTGVIKLRWNIRAESATPSRRNFVNMVQAELRRIFSEDEYQPINVSLGYVTPYNRTFYRSFRADEVKAQGISSLMALLLVSEEDRDDRLFHGSDVAVEIRGATLFPHVFEIYCYYTSGGNHHTKIEYDYYVCAGLSSDESNNCLIECFRYITSDERDANECRKSLSLPEGTRLSLKHVPLLERYYDVYVLVVEDRRRITFEYFNGADVYELDLFRAKVTKDKPFIRYGDPKKTAHKIVFKDGHFDVVVRELKARDRHCPYTGIFVGDGHLDEVEIMNTLVEQGRMTEENRDSGVVDIRTPWYYFFDYETTYNPNTLAMNPYAWSLVKCDEYGKICDKWIFANKSSKDDAGKFLMLRLRKEVAKENERSYLIGFNNSRFDNFILLEDAIRMNLSLTNVLFAGNSILSMNVGGFMVRDAYRMLMTSLKKACQSFGCQIGKGHLDHDEVQHAYMNGEQFFSAYLSDNREKILEYVYQDCESLAELFFKARDAFKMSSGLFIENHNTIASLTYRAFLANMPIKLKELPILSAELDELSRRATIGGRAEMFRPGTHVKKEMSCLDIVSLYPYVMMNNRFPIGKPVYTKDFVPGKIGFYDIEVLSQPKVNIVPYRPDGNGRLDWKYKEEIRRWLTSVDVEKLLDYDATLIVHEGYYWEQDRDDLFTDYFRKLAEAKMQQDRWKEEGDPRYNPALRECIKLMMNALSGKLIQRLFIKHKALVKKGKEMQKFLATIKPGTEVFSGSGSLILAEGEKLHVVPNMPTILGLLIYSYSRSYLYDNMINTVEEKYGTDTDSLFCTKESSIKLMKEMPSLFGNEFGQVKEELQSQMKENEKGPFGIFVAPKCYCFYALKEDGSKRVIKLRFKGVRTHADEEKNNDKVIFDEHLIKECDQWHVPTKELHEIYYTDYKKYGPGVVSVETFEQLIQGQTVYILCSSMIRQIGGGLVDTRVMLKQRFLLKKIAPSGEVTCF
jgi:hypothetical protein